MTLPPGPGHQLVCARAVYAGEQVDHDAELAGRPWQRGWLRTGPLASGNGVRVRLLCHEVVSVCHRARCAALHHLEPGIGAGADGRRCVPQGPTTALSGAEVQSETRELV